MKDSFYEYLHNIGVDDILVKRIETIYDFYENFCPDEIVSIFVTDFIRNDGKREYENLWFFSEQYCMEAKQFITNDDFDITPLKKRIEYITIVKQDYDFKKAQETSRFQLRCTFDTNTVCSLKASKENCDYLRVIFLKHIKTNIKDDVVMSSK